jgi:stress-induced morphogen
MICFTNDTPLRRVEHLTKLLEKVFEHVHAIELPAYSESKIQEFEEEFMEIQNPSNGEKTI